MLASSLREEGRATVSNKPGHRGEREVSRKTIARGMPGDFRCDRGDYARVLFYFAREAAGALSARHSLRPLLLRAAKQFLQTSGASRREIAESYLLWLFENRIGKRRVISLSASSRTSEPTGRAPARPMTGSASAIRDP